MTQELENQSLMKSEISEQNYSNVLDILCAVKPKRPCATTHCVVEFIKLCIPPEDKPFVLCNGHYHFVNLQNKPVKIHVNAKSITKL